MQKLKERAPHEIADSYYLGYVAGRAHQARTLGLRLSIHDDFERLGELRSRVEDWESWGPANPAYDQKVNTWGEDEALWICLSDEESGAPLAVEAVRFYPEAPGDLLRTGRMFADHGYPFDVEIDRECPLLVMPGPCSMCGSAWIHPTRRGTGLMGLMDWTLRTLMRARWGVATHWGMVNSTLGGKKLLLSARSYDYGRQGPCMTVLIHGHSPKTYLCGWVTGEEIDAAVGGLVPARRAAA